MCTLESLLETFLFQILSYSFHTASHEHAYNKNYRDIVFQNNGTSKSFHPKCASIASKLLQNKLVKVMH